MTGKLDTSRSYIIVSDWNWDTEALLDNSPVKIGTISVISAHHPQEAMGVRLWECHSVTRGQRKQKTHNLSEVVHYKCDIRSHIGPIQTMHSKLHWSSSQYRLNCHDMRSGSLSHTSIHFESPPFILVTTVHCSQLSPAHVTPPSLLLRAADPALCVTKTLQWRWAPIPHPRWCHHALKCQDSKHIWPLVIHFVIGKKSWVYFISAMCYQGTML